MDTKKWLTDSLMDKELDLEKIVEQLEQLGADALKEAGGDEDLLVFLDWCWEQNLKPEQVTIEQWYADSGQYLQENLATKVLEVANKFLEKR